MEVKREYIVTDIGKIPSDWDIEEIRKIVKKNDGIKIGPFGSQLKKSLLVERGYKVFGQENIYAQNMDIGERYITKEHFCKLKSCEIKEGDFIISMMGTIGKSMIVPDSIQQGIMDSHLLRLRLDNNMISSSFLYQVFDSWILFNQIDKLSVGGIMDGLSSKIVKEVQVPLPSLPEQQAIAEVLSDTDNLIQALEKQIAKKRLIKQGVMQKQLRPKDGWEKRRLGEIFFVTRGFVLPISKIKTTKDNEYRYPVYSSQTKENGLMGYYKEFIYEDSITWTTDGANAGDVKYRSGKFYCTNVCGVLINKEGYANIFVSEAFNQVSKKYVSYVGNPKLMNNVVKDIEIMFPSIDEQLRISKIFNELNSEIDFLEMKLEKIKHLKQGLMQQLLMGKIRLLKS